MAAAVCVCGRGVGMSTPPHTTLKRIMHIESIDSVSMLVGCKAIPREHLLQSVSIVILCACMISIH